MKKVKQFGHQGDTQWFEVDQIPKGAKKVNKQFIAESERSGSVHALFGDYDQYELPDGGYAIETKGECVLNHTLKHHLPKTMTEAVTLPKKDHHSAIIPAGKILFVGIHRRADPLSATFKRVID